MIQLFSFLFGAAVGSFVNVVAARVVAGKSIVTPRSFCDACAKPLLPRDMIPVISFFLRRARCRFCHANISWQYPVVELAVAFLFFFAADADRGTLELVFFWIAIAVLVTLFLTDLRAMVLPDRITIPAIVVLAAIAFFGLHVGFVSLLVAVLVGGGFFFLQYFFSHGAWVGSGDIRFGILMGVILRSPLDVVWALIVAYILGAFVSVVLLVMRKRGLKSEIPLGSFLAIGTIAVLFFVS